MLTITEEAGDLIKVVVETNAGPTAAMRIAAMPVDDDTNGSRGLGLQFVLHPEADDEVVTAPGGSQVIVDSQVASILDDKILDAVFDESGNGSLVLVGPKT